MSGWIKDYRKEVESAIWQMPPLYHRVWQYIKYTANHKDNKIPLVDGTEMTIKKGQNLTSIRNIARGVGYFEGRSWKEPSTHTISKIIKFMEQQNMITVDRGKNNREYTLITIKNWDEYQSYDNDIKKTNEKENKKQEDVYILSKEEEEILKILSKVENYPLDRKKDIEMIKRLKERYKELNIVESIKDWATYKLDKPLKEKDNARSQINTACKNYLKWGKNLNATNTRCNKKSKYNEEQLKKFKAF